MKTVLTTRPGGDRDELAERLVRSGYRALAIPTVALEPVPPGGALDEAAAQLAAYDWVIVTSAAGARAVLDAMARAPARTAGGGVRWAAVGPATRRALEKGGLEVTLVPDEARGTALADALARLAPRSPRPRVLLPRADAADPALPTALRRAGAVVDEVVAYHTREAPAASRAPLLEALDRADLRAIVVASGSAVRGLARLTAGADTAARTARSRLDVLGVVSIGPSTSAVARSVGLRVTAQATEPSVDGLIAAVRAISTPEVEVLA